MMIIKTIGFYCICYLLMTYSLALPGHYFKSTSKLSDKDPDLEDVAKALLIQTQVKADRALLLKNAAIEASQKAEQLNEQATIAERQAESAAHLLQSVRRLTPDNEDEMKTVVDNAKNDEYDLKQPILLNRLNSKSYLDQLAERNMKNSLTNKQSALVEQVRKRIAKNPKHSMDLLLNSRALRVPVRFDNSHETIHRIHTSQLSPSDQVALEAIRLALIQDLIEQQYHPSYKELSSRGKLNPSRLRDSGDVGDKDDDSGDDDDDDMITAATTIRNDDQDSANSPSTISTSDVEFDPENNDPPVSMVEHVLMKEPLPYSPQSILNYEEQFGRDRRHTNWKYHEPILLDPLLED